jgi:hypothetical protein
MPVEVVQQQSLSHGYNMTAEKYDSQMKSHEVSGENDDNARGEYLALDAYSVLYESISVLQQLTPAAIDMRARKWVAKSPSDSLESQSRQEGTTVSATTESPPNYVGRRRPSVRDQKVPLGARPLEGSPTKK